MTEPTSDRTDEPVNINAIGPSNVADQVTVTRHYDNNVDAFDDKQAESVKAQTAKNPTTDVDLAREAYGEDWNKRRGPKQIAETRDGDPIYARGGVAVDTAGHALGHASDPGRAADLRERLVHSPEATDADRYPVTAEAKRRDNDDES
jgi:hypothetical protein